MLLPILRNVTFKTNIINKNNKVKNYIIKYIKINHRDFFFYKKKVVNEFLNVYKCYNVITKQASKVIL
jgi:hypothetical protein